MSGSWKKFISVVAAFALAVPLGLAQWVETPTAEAAGGTLSGFSAPATTQVVHGNFIMVGNGVLDCANLTNADNWYANGIYDGIRYNQIQYNGTWYSGTNDVAKYSCMAYHNGTTISLYNSTYGYRRNAVVPANDDFNLKYTKVAGSTLMNSSQAQYTIPAGAKVVWAKLYWAGNTGTAAGGGINTCSGGNTATPPSGSPKTTSVSMTVNGSTTSYLPGGSYTTDENSGIVTNANGYYYGASADVTSVFSGTVGTGSAMTVTVGNIWTPQGYGCMGGWGLELIYDFGKFDINNQDASQKRTIYVYDGYARESGSLSTDIGIAGLLPQGDGAKIGTIAYEGDKGIAGDSITYSDPNTSARQLAGPWPAGGGTTDNYYVGYANGAVPYGTSTANPNWFGSTVDVSYGPLPDLTTGDPSLNLKLGTTGDSYMLQNVTVSVPNADVSIAKTALNGEQDQAYAPGSTPSFLITVMNSGSVAIQQLTVTDELAKVCGKTTAEMTAIIQQQGYADGKIPAGGSVKYTCSTSPTSTSYDNFASVIGQTGSGIPVTGSNTSRVLMATWDVKKTAKYPDVPAGTAPIWVITIRNTGDADIFNTQINDTNAPACSRLIPQITAKTDFSYECAGPVNATGTSGTGTTALNSITATGSGQATSTSQNKVPLTYDGTSTPASVQSSDITITKTVDKPMANIGEAVTFTFTLKNTGTSTLPGWTMTDALFPSCNKSSTAAFAPGASTTFTCTVTPFPAASSTQVKNVGVVSANPPSGIPITASSTATVDNKALALTKTATTTDRNGNNVLDAGDTVAYSFALKNNGSVALNSLSIADAKLPGATFTCTPTTLAPGASGTCTTTSTYRVTQTDVDSGKLVNTATATGTAPNGTTTTDTASVTLNPVQQPSISITKTANPTTVAKVGDIVEYSFLLKNTGNTTLSKVTMTDPISGLSPLSCKTVSGVIVPLPAIFPPQSTLTCTATRAATQTDINAGVINNTASVTGLSPAGTVVNADSKAQVTATRTADASFTKQAVPTTFSKLGEVIQFKFTTKNEGNTTLTGVQPVDPSPRLVNRVCTPASPATLQPGEQQVCTAEMTVTQPDLDAGAITNTATLSATPPSGMPAISKSANAVVTPAKAPVIELDKSANRTTVDTVGQVVTYTYTVTNSGNVTEQNVKLVDPMPGLSALSCSPAQPATLAPAAKMICTATHTVTQPDLDNPSKQLSNTATVSANYKDNAGAVQIVPSQSDTVDITVTQTPTITLSKSPNPSQISAPGPIAYSFVVKNTGNVTLTNLRLTDPLIPSGITCAPTALGGTLGPNASTTCTGSYNATQTDVDAGVINNTATATLTPPVGADVTSTAVAKVTAISTPDYTIKKTPTPTVITAAGQQISYSVVISNTGNVTLSNLAVTDPKATLTCTPTALGGALAPNTSTTCTGLYNSTQTEFDSGSVNNTATATLTPPTGAALTKSSSATVQTQRRSELTITKVGSTRSYSRVGDTISYTITARNNGNVTINNATVTDPMFPASAPLNCTPAVPVAQLIPGGTISCTGTRAIEQADLDATKLSNTATASGTGADGSKPTATAEWTATAVLSPSASLTKTANPATVSGANKSITYTVVYENTGNTTLANVRLSDPMFPTWTSCSPALGSSLTPGGKMTCTGSYTSTLADANAGAIKNTASSTATPPGGTLTNPTADAVVTIASAPSLSLSKTASTGRVTKVGEVITYSFLVTNTGNVTVSSIGVTDTDLAGLSPISCPATSLEPTQTTTCTATYSVTQPDLDRNPAKIPNTATVHGVDPKGVAVPEVSSSTSVEVGQTSTLALAKTADVASVSKVGDPINYTVVATNKGNTTISNVQIADPMFSTWSSCDPALGSSLAPNATMTCKAARTATLADLNNGQISNTATVTGTSPTGTPVTPTSSTAKVTATQNPSYTLKKTASVQSVNEVGTTITYSYVVANDGNVSLSALKIADPHAGLSTIACLATSLDPGNSTTCTATYTVKQTDLDAGSITNTATSTMNPPIGTALTRTDSAVVTVQSQPRLSMTKTSSQETYRTVDRVITYSFEVQNSGNVTMKNVTVTDTDLPGLSAITCTPAQGATLAPRDTMSCSATYAIKQTDIDRGSIANTAKVTGTSPDGATTSTEASKTITANQNPAMALVKSASPATVTKAGDTVRYSFLVTNTGNVTMTNIAVTDPLQGLSAVSCPVTELAPTGTTTCTASYTVTQPDMDKGSIDNTATLKGTDPKGGTVSTTSTAKVAATQAPKLALTKTPNPAQISAAGQQVNYTFHVTNTGTVTVNDIKVADPLPDLSSVSCPQPSLKPLEGMDCTASYTAKQSDVDAKKIPNTATVTGTTATGTPVPSASANAEVTATQTPTYTLEKKADRTEVRAVGEVINYTVRATNTGNVTLSNFTLLDDLPGRSTLACYIYDATGRQLRIGTGAISLAPTEYKECTYTYTVALKDLNAGTITNTVYATPSSPAGAMPRQEASAIVKAIQTPTFTLDKTSDIATYTTVGQTVTYTLVMTNTGNVTIGNATISDPHQGLSPLTCTPALGSSLEPKATMRCSGSYKVTQTDIDGLKITNTATASGTDPQGKQLTPISKVLEITAVLNPSIDVTKTVNPSTISAAGTEVTYTVKIRNTGNATVSSGTIADPMPGLSAWTCDVRSIKPDETATCTATKTITQQEFNAGVLKNTATASGTAADGRTVSGTDSMTLQMTQSPKLSIVKAANPTTVSKVGDQVTYTFTVKNEGNVTVNAIKVTDPLAGLSSVSCPQPSLDPTKSMDCTATYATKQSDLDAGSITNTAKVNGTTQSGTAVPEASSNTALVTATQSPSWTLTKSASPASISTLGEVITYTFVLTNTGNVTLSNMKILDPMTATGMSTLACQIYSSSTNAQLRPGTGAVLVAPGEYKKCTASYSAKQSDLNAGAINNTATVTGNTPTGPLTSANGNLSADAVVQVVQDPKFTFAKTASTKTFTGANQTITYSFLFTNTGNVDLTNVQIKDPKTGLSPLSCTPSLGSTIVPKARMSCTASYTTTQTDMDALSITNTATADANGPAAALPQQTSSTLITGVANPKMQTTKSANPATVTKAGQIVEYTVTVLNTGNLTLTNGSLDDPMFQASDWTCDVTKIAPGQTATCTAHHEVTQDEFDAANATLTNTVKAKATASNGTPVENTGTANVHMDVQPKLVVTKVADKQSVNAPGQILNYTFTVKNDGNTTINGIVLNDPKISSTPLTCPKSTLAPGTEMTCSASYTVTQPDIDAHAVKNTASATGTTPSGVAVPPASGESSVPAEWTQTWTFQKSASQYYVDKIGTTVKYELVVTNTGNVTLQNVFMSDPMTAGALLVECSVLNADGSTAAPAPGAVALLPGQRKVCHWYKTFDQAAFEQPTQTGSTGVDPLDPTITDAAGHPVLYAQDGTVVPLDDSGNPEVDGNGSPLVPGPYHTKPKAKALLVVPNQAQVKATTPDGQPVNGGQGLYSSAPTGPVPAGTAPDGTQIPAGTASNGGTTTDVYLYPSPDFEMTKSASPTTYRYRGQRIFYTINAKNSGNVTLNNVSITDRVLDPASMSCSPVAGSSLAPGATMTCTGAYVVTQNDVDNPSGAIVNNATGHGTDAQGIVHDASASAVVTVKYAGASGITIDKSAVPANVTYAGQKIKYSFVLTNNGLGAISDVVVKDPLPGLSGITCPQNTIPANTDDGQGSPVPPFQQITCSADYTVTQDDVNAGKIVNKADATGVQGGKTVTDNSTFTVNAAHVTTMTFTKTAAIVDGDGTGNTTSVDSTNDRVNYSFVVTNTGNILEKNIAITDPIPGLSAVSCPKTELYPASVDAAGAAIPGESMICTASMPVSQAQLNGKTIPNTATVNATDRDGVARTLTAKASVPVTWKPSYTFEKKVDKERFSRVGEVLNYTFTTTNTGNVQLYNVMPKDTLAGLSTLTCDKQSLEPGETQKCTATYTIKQSDLDSNAVTNSAVLASNTPDGGTVPQKPSAQVSTADATASLSVTKVVDKPQYGRVGEVLTYTILVTNTGNTSQTNVQVTDKIDGVALSCTPALGSTLPGVDSVNNTMRCTGIYKVTQPDLDNKVIENIAYVTGQSSNTTRFPTPTTDDSSEAPAISKAVLAPGIKLAKSADKSSVSQAGEQVKYSFVVTNVGNVTLNNVGVTDTFSAGGHGTMTAITCAKTTLVPDENTTCTATYTVAQEDIDNAQLQSSPVVGLSNTATASGTDTAGSTVTHEASLDLGIELHPKIEVTKTPSPATVNAVGQVVTYTFMISNTGNVHVGVTAIRDAMPGLSTPQCDTLQIPVGGTVKCTATLEVTQQTLDGGTFPNTVYVDATAKDGATRADQVNASAKVVVEQHPLATLSKTANPTTVTDVGTPVTYTMTTTNTGNVTLSNVAIRDPLLAGLARTCTMTPKGGSASSVLEPVILAPGDSLTCEATRPVTQTEVNAGSLVNTAYLFSRDPAGVEVPPVGDDAVVTITPNPRLSITKQESSSTYSSVGQRIDYSFAIRNEGNVSLTNVHVDDALPGLTTLTCTPAVGSTLASGQTMSCDAAYTITQPDIDRGKVENTASVLGKPPTGAEISATSNTVLATAITTSTMTLTKTPNPSSVTKAGEIITYSFVVDNTGNTTLKNLVVTDTMPGLSAVDCHAVTELAPNATTTCTATYEVTQHDIDYGKPEVAAPEMPSIRNVAVATATNPSNAAVKSDEARARVSTDHKPSATIEKTVTPTTYDHVGQVLKYDFTITNTGNVLIINGELHDKLAGLRDLHCDTPDLPVAAVNHCTAYYDVTQKDLDDGSIVNIATSSGTDTTGTIKISGQATATAKAVQNPAMTLAKSSDVTTVSKAGNTINYTQVVTNTGNVTLGNLVIADPLPGVVRNTCYVTAVDGTQRTTQGAQAIAPGENYTCTWTYTVTQTDMNAGAITNVGRVTGNGPSGVPVPPKDSNPTVVTVTPDPSISVTKSVRQPTYSAVGDVLDYDFVITNTGNITLDNIQMLDTLPVTALTCLPVLGASLDPGKTMTCTAKYMISQPDLDAQKVENVASVTSTPPAFVTTGPVTATSQKATSVAVQDPKITISKTASMSSVAKAGQVIHYTFDVANAGNVTLTEIAVNDPLNNGTMLPVTCSVTSLKPSTSTLCTASYTLQQSDIDALGRTLPDGTIPLTNVATVTGKGPDGRTASNSDQVTVSIQHLPKVELAKSVSPQTVNRVGDVVTYTFTITNAGNITLKGLNLTDRIAGLGPITCDKDLATATIAPTEQIVCHADKTVSLTDMDSVAVTNNASVTAKDIDGDKSVSAQGAATFTPAPNPSVTLTKTANPTTVNAVGQIITYTFVATNTGNVTLHNTFIKDPHQGLPVLACTITAVDGTSRDGTGPHDLAPGETKTCEARYATTQPNLDAGTITNTAMVDATTNGPSVHQESSAVVRAEQSAAIQLVKSVNPTRVQKAGDTVTYAFAIKNTGTVTLANPRLTDTMSGLSAYTCDTPLADPLAPNEERHCTATITATEAQMNMPTVNNQATVTADTPQSMQATTPTVSSTSNAQWIPVHVPKLELSKKHAPATYDTLNQTLTYTFTVRNAGNVVVDQVRVTDLMPGLSTPVCEKTRLSVGETTTCSSTYQIKQDDLDKGVITNNAEVNGIVPAEFGGDPVPTATAQDTALATRNPDLSVTKVANSLTPLPLGAEAHYTVTVTNTGNVTLTNVTISEPDWVALKSFTCDKGTTLATFAPGAVVTCQSVVTVDQTAFDQGVVVNEVEVEYSSNGSAQKPKYADASIPTVPGTASMVLDKVADKPEVHAAGDQLNYTITLTNTGSYTLFMGAVADTMPNLMNFQCDQAADNFELAPGKVLTCHASYTTTLADMNAGKVVNDKVTASAYTVQNGTITAEKTLVTPAIQEPKLTLTKSADRSSVNAVGDKIIYRLSVVNTGNVTTSFVQINEALRGATAPSCVNASGTPVALPATLNPRDQLSCTVEYAVKQADLDAGAITNSAAVTGTSPKTPQHPDGTPVTSNTDSAVVKANQDPSVSMSKTADTTLVQKVGDTINYTIKVTNTGNVTLSNIVVTDPMLPRLSCDVSGQLAPQQTVTCRGSYTVTHTDLENGKVINTADFDSTDPQGKPILADASYNVTALYNPKLSFSKTVSAPTNWVAGQQAAYTFTVTNVGNMDAYHLLPNDSMNDLSGLVCTLPDGRVVQTNSSSPFPPGMTVTCRANYTIKQVDVDSGFITNTATIDAKEATGQAFPQEQATARTETKQVGSMTLSKKADRTQIAKAGEVVNYTFTATNTSNVTLSSLVVHDQLSGISEIVCDSQTIAPHASVNCHATYLVLQSDIDKGFVDNKASATAKTPNSTVNAQTTLTADSNLVHLPALQTPALSMIKESTTSSVSKAGEVAKFTLHVSNTGNVTAKNVSITDPAPATITGCDRQAPISLLPGEEVTCHVDYVVQQEEIDQQIVINKATADATTPLGVAFKQAAATKSVPADRVPQLDLVKTADRQTVSQVGEQVTYTMTATNSGNTTLYSVKITDPMPGLSAMTCAQPTTLAPGQTLTCTATYASTVANMDAGQITNTARVSGDMLGGDPNSTSDDVVKDASARVGVVQRPHLALTKVADRASVASRADAINYTFTVTNDGNVTITEIVLSDPFTAEGMTVPNCPKKVLIPGESMSCTATYYSTQPHMDKGEILNTASVTGFDPNQIELPAMTATAKVAVEQKPAMKLTKQTDHQMILAAGEAVQYTFVGTNTGNVTLSVVDVIDETFAGKLTLERNGTTPGMSCAPKLPAILPPGDSVICIAWYRTTQADLNNYSFVNHAKMTSLDPHGNPVPPVHAEAEIKTQTHTEMSLNKIPSVQTVSKLGDPITYTFKAKNWSNVTIHDVVITDPMKDRGLSELSCDQPMPFTLAPYEQATCTATYAAGYADFDQGFILNKATVTAKQPDGTPLEPVSASTRVEAIQAPSIAVTNVPDVPNVSHLGEPITYTFTVTNTGNTSVGKVGLNVPQEGLSGLTWYYNGAVVSADQLSSIVLKPGESLVAVATYDTKQTDLDKGQVDNVATATGTYRKHTATPNPADLSTIIDSYDDAAPVTPAQAPSTVPVVQKVEMTMTKTPDQTSVSEVGQLITYTFTSTNVGNVTMHVTGVDDPRGGVIMTGCTPEVPMDLAPGKTIVCTGQYHVTQDDIDSGVINNTATVTAIPPSGSPYTTPQASATVVGAKSVKATLAKVAAIADENGNGRADEGETVTYTITAKNLGNTTLHRAVVHDPMLANLACSPALPATIAPGSSVVCTGTHVVTHEEANAASGELSNTATLTGDEFGGGVTGGAVPPVASTAVIAVTPKKVLANTGLSIPTGLSAVDALNAYAVSDTMKSGPGSLAAWVVLMGACMIAGVRRTLRGTEE